MSDKSKNNNDSEFLGNALAFTGAVLGMGAGPLGIVCGALVGKVLGSITNPPQNDD